MKIFVKGGQWSNNEDQLLLAFVRNHGLNSWGSIAASITRKTAEQCKQRWEEYLDPTINKGDWSIGEKQTLLETYEVFPDQWATIATYLERRRPWQCQEQFERIRGGGGVEGDDDAAQEDSGAVSSGASGLKVFHEMREARKDRVDGDEYEENMMELGRARLANQAGRKDFRKEKKKEEDHTRAITVLQRKNEMASAGVATAAQERKFSKALQEDKRFVSGDKREREDDDIENDSGFVPVKMSEVLGTKGTAVRSANDKGRRDLLADHVATQQEAWKNNSLLPDFSVATTTAMIEGRGVTPQAVTGPKDQPSADDDFLTNLLGSFESHHVPALGSAAAVNEMAEVPQEEEEDMFADLPEGGVDFSDLPEPVIAADEQTNEETNEEMKAAPIALMSRHESRVAAQKLLKMATTSRWKLWVMEQGVPHGELIRSIRGARELIQHEMVNMDTSDCVHSRVLFLQRQTAVSSEVVERCRQEELAAALEEWRSVGATSFVTSVSVPPGTYSGLHGAKAEMDDRELVQEWELLRKRTVDEYATLADFEGRLARVKALISHEEKMSKLRTLRSTRGNAEFPDILSLLSE